MGIALLLCYIPTKRVSKSSLKDLSCIRYRTGLKSIGFTIQEANGLEPRFLISFAREKSFSSFYNTTDRSFSPYLPFPDLVRFETLLKGDGVSTATYCCAVGCLVVIVCFETVGRSSRPARRNSLQNQLAIGDIIPQGHSERNLLGSLPPF